MYKSNCLVEQHRTDLILKELESEEEYEYDEQCSKLSHCEDEHVCESENIIICVLEVLLGQIIWAGFYSP